MGQLGGEVVCNVPRIRLYVSPDRWWSDFGEDVLPRGVMHQLLSPGPCDLTRGSEALSLSSHAATWSLLLPIQRIQWRKLPTKAALPPNNSCHARGACWIL